MENLIKIIISLLIAFIAYKIHKYFHNVNKKQEKKIEDIKLDIYKNTGRHIRKPIDEFFITENKEKEDVSDVEAKDFQDYISRPRSRFENDVFVEVNKTRISCYVDILGKERLLYKNVNYDYTVVQVKARMQGYIDIYIVEGIDENGKNSYDWHFDTSFLEKDLL